MKQTKEKIRTTWNASTQQKRETSPRCQRQPKLVLAPTPLCRAWSCSMSQAILLWTRAQSFMPHTSLLRKVLHCASPLAGKHMAVVVLVIVCVLSSKSYPYYGPANLTASLAFVTFRRPPGGQRYTGVYRGLQSGVSVF